MALVYELRRGQKVLVNGAQIAIVNKKVKIAFQNHAAFVLGNQVMDEDKAHTLSRNIYLALQNAYAGERKNREQNCEKFLDLADKFAKQYPGKKTIIDEMFALAEQNKIYEALKLAKVLIKYEDNLPTPQPSVSATKPTPLGVKQLG